MGLVLTVVKDGGVAMMEERDVGRRMVMRMVMTRVKSVEMPGICSRPGGELFALKPNWTGLMLKLRVEVEIPS